MKKTFKWDDYSDQPAIIEDRAFKKKMRKKEFVSLVKTIITSLVILPLSTMMMPYVKRKEIKSSDFFSVGVDFEREPQKALEFLDELNVDKVLLRFKLWEMDSLDELKSFVEKLDGKKIILKVMQDRENIENLELFRTNLQTVFKTLGTSIETYEIGTTINRAKWGFFSVDEYSKFYKIAYDLREKEFASLTLIGSGVIDFEYHFTAHTLFNFFNYKYDGISSLLYVDRRGAPEHTQLGFNLSDKIALLSTMVWLSPKTKNILHITETNYPLSNTAPYAPTSEHECISEELYADFMLRYYLLAFASQQVDSVSWHQLMAKGYGLVNDVDGMQKREAYFVYRFMVKNLKNAQFLRLDIKRDYYILQFLVDDKLLQIHWSLKDTTLKNEDFFEVYSSAGDRIVDETLEIGSSPLYIYITKEVGEKVNCI